MSSAHYRRIGAVCLVLCAICVFVAVERYRAKEPLAGAIDEIAEVASAEKVADPLIPTATTYALLTAALFGAGGVYSFVKARKRE
jgi:hypothetical protein